MTTAAKLKAYREELLQGNFPEDLVNDLVRDAAGNLLNREDLSVKPDS